MDRAYGMDGAKGTHVIVIGVKGRRKETIRKTKT
jgi:hypothetical protein